MSHLILLPGLLCDAALWHAQSQSLAEAWQVTVPSLAMHNNLPDLAAQVLATAPPHFSLAGLSMGGYVAMEIMRQAPERVTRLALFDTSARPDTPEQREKRQGLIRLSQTGKFKGVTPRLLPMLIHPSNLENHAITETVLGMAARIGQEGFERQQTAILGRIDSRPSLPAIRCPTLVVVGAEDQLTPPEIAHETAGLIPQAQVTIIPHCGHLPPLEQPERTTELLRHWLA
ncbi:MAG: alpha/beta fold hydrolase [Alphaproteobacteria bacterium]|nr:alpha/beta fold hydrolase [Alphaproteobacteria bacterium]